MYFPTEWQLSARDGILHGVRGKKISRGIQPAGATPCPWCSCLAVWIVRQIGETDLDWLKLFDETGSVAPRQVGGYKPRKISGAFRDWLVGRCREQDFTLRGLVAELGERGLKVDYRSVWEFVHAEGLSYKKRP